MNENYVHFCDNCCSNLKYTENSNVSTTLICHFDKSLPSFQINTKCRWCYSSIDNNGKCTFNKTHTIIPNTR